MKIVLAQIITYNVEAGNLVCYKKAYYKRDGKRLKKLIMKGLNTYTGDKVVVTMYEYDSYWSVLEIVENDNVKILFKIHQNII